MNTNRGATLVELMISIVVITIVSLGFFNWLGTVMRMNTSIEKTNNAFAMANDVAGRLQRMNDNALIQHATANKRCVGFDATDADMQGCSTTNCGGGSPNVPISTGSGGLIKFADPWNVWSVTTPNTTPTGTRLYLYSKSNGCADKTWVDSACRTSVTVTTAAAETIDHPNAATTAYDSVNPIRYYKGTTYYAVWSVAYMPCSAGTDTNKRKIFITVYWITPEPTDATAAAALTKLNNGTYTLKSISLVADKTIGAET